MTVVAVVGSKHAPGASTLAVALAALARGGQPVLVVEADPAGGDLAARSGLPLDPGLLTLAAAGRRGLTPQLIEAHTQVLPNGVPALLAPASPEHAHAAIIGIGAALASSLRDRQGTTVIDGGRLDARSCAAELVRSADVIVVVFRPTVEGVEHARMRLLSLSGTRVIAAMLGERPYRAAEVAAALGDIELCVIDEDAHAATAIGAAMPLDRWLRRTALVRSAHSLLDRISTDSVMHEEVV